MIAVIRITIFFFLYSLISYSDPAVYFVDCADSAGVDFIHAGGIDKKVIPAIVGSGAAFVDYDNDGDLDLYLVNTAQPHESSNQPGGDVDSRPTNALYQNEGQGRFTEVAKQVGLDHDGWGMGCAFADYDNDGDADLYLTNYLANVFFKNLGDGTFKQASSGAGGIGDNRFGSGISWIDYDNDGFLDLYVGNYLDYGKIPSGADNFFPYDFTGQNNVLYFNRGDGRFMDVTNSIGISGGNHLTLGVAGADYDNDGDIDLYLANDTDQNILYRNDGESNFTNTNLADHRSHTGDIRGGMGITWGDYDNDGDLDLLVTNWLDENNVLYRNNGDGTFIDVSSSSGIFESGIGKTCWGTEFFDYDNDGDLDLYITCGHIDPASWQMPGGQTDILLRNNGDDTFSDVSSEAGIIELGKMLGRGAAFGDYDQDGDVDILVVNAGQKAQLLRNEGGNHNNWLHLKLIGTASNRDGIGAKVRLTANGQNQLREVVCGTSYLSQSSIEVEFGLGTAQTVDRIEILWPSGRKQILTSIEINQRLQVVEPDPKDTR